MRFIALLTAGCVAAALGCTMDVQPTDDAGETTASNAGKADSANAPAGACPGGGGYSANAELSFCLWDVTPLPAAEVRSYCDYLDEGYLGFGFDPQAQLQAWGSPYSCPAGMRLADDGSGAWNYCLIEGLSPVPPGAQPYCMYIDEGYIGYSVPVASAASCKACVEGGGGTACAARCPEGICRTCVEYGGGEACLAECGAPLD
ncbi:MAG: hypothetical protein JRI23_09800 [Deltaproteobacteria bacterium]|jgi:hypothetical protein|nr:hypothetical protein [Deltaproteobacteria bacterium]MBW2531961.1 hypothetical protein [Deltaproteobacteria bacterium]